MKFKYEIWDEAFPRYQEFVQAVELIVPDQLPFVTGQYFKANPNYTFVALDNKVIAGFIRYCKQPIGPEAKCTEVTLKNQVLLEAKINAFAVDPNYRNKGIGKNLQKIVLAHAKGNNCYQVASYSTFDKKENYSVKLTMGFSVQTETQADGTKGGYFLMPLSHWQSDDDIIWDTPKKNF